MFKDALNGNTNNLRTGLRIVAQQELWYRGATSSRTSATAWRPIFHAAVFLTVTLTLLLGIDRKLLGVF